MKIIWQVDDGYVGGRPQYTTIDDSDLEDFETEEEKEQFIQDYIQQEFENRISWYITRRD